MLHRPHISVSSDDIAAMVGEHAAERDRDGRFPELGFERLRELGLVAAPPIGPEDAATLFGVLAAVGRGDMSVGRIFEGHVNALYLIETFGTPSQREIYRQLAADGKIFGIWNTDVPQHPVRIEGTRLQGRKNFASGVDGLSHAIITASQPQGRLMVVVPVAGLPVDRSWWRPLGMRASGSHVVDFAGSQIEPDWLLGGFNDYIEEPRFTAGAIRFAAVHVGGMHAVLDAAVTHLRGTKRSADPHQRHRMGRMAIAVESGYAWLDRAVKHWPDLQPGRTPVKVSIMIALANGVRLAVESAALTVLQEAERSIGAAGLIAPHPLERLVRDLRTYLRQPNPDAALASLGAAVAEGSWSPGGFRLQAHA
jgi:alkylation response protein AidB-like acyl-CoA dehydrogenase